MSRRAFSVAIFVRHAGRVLLVKHARLGTWLPVGGEIENGETPLEAARRELREETGLVGNFGAPLMDVDGTPAGLIGYEEHPAGSKGLHMNFAFVADVDSPDITPNEEFSAHQWVDDASAIECPKNVRQLLRIALAGSSDALVAVATRWLRAFNERDLDGLLALYAAEPVHSSPKLRAREPATGGKVIGRDALRAWWADAMQRLPGLRYEARHLTASGSRVFMEYERVVPGEENLVVAEVLVVDREGLIAESHVFHG